jgi:hypothetical protein
VVFSFTSKPSLLEFVSERKNQRRNASCGWFLIFKRELKGTRAKRVILISALRFRGYFTQRPTRPLVFSKLRSIMFLRAFDFQSGALSGTLRSKESCILGLPITRLPSPKPRASDLEAERSSLLGLSQRHPWSKATRYSGERGGEVC